MRDAGVRAEELGRRQYGLVVKLSTGRQCVLEVISEGLGGGSVAIMEDTECS